MTNTAAVRVDIQLLVRWCSSCEAETFFEAPECLDEHGVECPERLCVACGAALLVGFDLQEPVRSSARASHVA